MPKFIDWVAGLPSTVGSEINLNDKLYIYDVLDPTVSKTTTVGSLLTSTNVISALITPTNIQAALSADPTGAWGAIVPDTIEVDYIVTTDQSLSTIPDYAFSRKGDTPYFGNSPLVEGTTKIVNRQQITKAAGANIWHTKPLALIPISEFVTVGAGAVDLFLEIDIDMTFAGTTVGSEDWHICIIDNSKLADLISGVDITGILYFNVIPDNPALRNNVILKVNSILYTSSISPTEITIYASIGGNGQKFNSDLASSFVVSLFANDGLNIQSGTGRITNDTSAILGFYLVPWPAAAANAQVYNVSGKIRLTGPLTYD